MSKFNIRIKRLCFLITRRCNLWCKMCDYRVIHFAEKELALDQIKIMLNDAKDLGMEWLDITGGEPLMRKDLYEIISYSKSIGIKVSMCTNGTLIGKEESEKLVDSGLNSVVISLEGFETLNDHLRGKGNYQKAINALKYFVKQKEKMVHIKSGVIISKMNYLHIFELTKYLFEEIGINSISYNPFTKWMLTHKKHENLEDFIITDDLLPQLKIELDKISSYGKTRDGYFPDDIYFKKIPDYFSGKNLLPENGCTQPLNACGVEANGLVYPCLVEHIPAGNVTESSLKEILTGKKYQAACFRALNKKCEGCLSACYDKVHSVKNPVNLECLP